MKPSAILFRYIAKRFLFWFLALMVIILSIILLFEYVEMLRRGANRPEVTAQVALTLSLLKMAETVELVLPFGIMFGAMFTFWHLTRSQELIVVRGAGLSAWQFIMPVIAAAAGLGIVMVLLLNPAFAALQAKFEQMEALFFDGRESLLEVSGGGLWLRQKDEDGISVIFAEGIDLPGIELRDVIVFLYTPENRYRGRIDAEEASLGSGEWQISDAFVKMGSERPVEHRDYRLPTTLTAASIEESFAPPRTISFWELPGFIESMEATGFSARAHEIRFQSLLSQPLLFAAMVLFAAVFSLRQTRRGGTLGMVVGGIITGFLVFVFSDIVLALGAAENLPIILAAWAPALATALVGIATLMHIEDG